MYLPIQEPNGLSTPVCRNKAMDSDLPIPRSAFLTMSVLQYVKRAHADLVIGYHLCTGQFPTEMRIGSPFSWESSQALGSRLRRLVGHSFGVY